jgi:DNA-binding beta-propeller fold protein YncE
MVGSQATMDTRFNFESWRLGIALVLLTAVLAAYSSAATPQQPLPLKLLRDIPLPGSTARFDHESLDPNTGLLFIAHSGDSSVLAFDTNTQKLVAEIPGVSRVHGVLAVPPLGRVYASATGTNEVGAIDERTFRIVARIPGGYDPDGLAFDRDDHKLFVSDGRGRSETVIDTDTERQVATIQIGSEAGDTQFDPVSGRVYVEAQSENALVAINAKTNKVVGRYALPGCDQDHTLNIDVPDRLAFIACHGNAKLLIFDLRTMRAIGIHSVGEDPDLLSFDAGLKRLYVASESGVVAVFQEKNLRLVELGQGFLAYNAHSVAVDTRHRVYFPLQDVNGRPVLRVMAAVTN